MDEINDDNEMKDHLFDVNYIIQIAYRRNPYHNDNEKEKEQKNKSFSFFPTLDNVVQFIGEGKNIFPINKIQRDMQKYSIFFNIFLEKKI